MNKDFIRTLEALNLLARKVRSGESRGERPSPRRGASLEFADYRHYTPGDEIRYIDWNVFARHDNLFVKEFVAEENVHATILLDASASMTFEGKFEAARELAAALAYIGLVNFDTVSLYAFTDQLRTLRKFLRGKNQIFDVLAELEKLQPEGKTDFRSAFATTFPKLKGKCLVLVLTDFYDLAGTADAVKALQAQRFEVNLIHLVAREEVEPRARGRYRLVDLESGRQKDVMLMPDTVERYRRRFDAYCHELERTAREREVAYVRVRSDEPIEKRVVDIVRAGGILERR